MPEFLIPVRQPFNFKECKWFVDRGFGDCMQIVYEDSIEKTVRVGGNVFLIRISEKDNKLTGNVLNDVPNRSQIHQIIKYVGSWFDLERDIIPFYKLAEDDKLLSELIESYYGLRLIGIEDLFEAFCWAIIGQQINLNFAYKLKRNLVSTFGDRYDHSQKIFFLFPEPEVIAELKDSDLLKLQFSRQKADYIINLAKDFLTGKIKESELYQIDDTEELLKRLQEIRGVGRWTSEYVAMRHFKRMDTFPMDDTGLQNAVKSKLKIKNKPDHHQLKSIKEKWSKWGAYATLYLWRSLADH